MTPQLGQYQYQAHNFANINACRGVTRVGSPWGLGLPYHLTMNYLRPPVLSSVIVMMVECVVWRSESCLATSRLDILNLGQRA